MYETTRGLHLYSHTCITYVKVITTAVRQHRSYIVMHTLHVWIQFKYRYRIFTESTIV